MYLLGLSDKLKQSQIKHSVFFEPDIGNQATALVIEPGEASRKICSNLPLALRGNPSNGKISDSNPEDLGSIPSYPTKLNT